MISRRIVINVITFLVISAIVIAALMINIFRIQPRYAVVAEFENTGGSFTGQEVTYRGVTVGRIGELRISERGVLMELVIESTFDEIPAQDIRARVMFKSAVGEQFVDLLPQSTGPPFLTDGDEIPIERTALPVQQEELLRLLSGVLDGVPPESLSNLVDTLGTALGGRGEVLHRALGALDPVTEVLARRADELNRINVNADRLGAAFSATSGEFVAGTRHLATVSQALGRSAGEIERLLEGGAVGIPELAGLLAARKGEIDRTIANVAELTRISFEHIASVEDTLDWLPLFLEVIVRIYDPELNRLRFSLTTVEGNEPCSYGTPRRPTDDRSGNAPHQPVIHFDCVEGGGGFSGGSAPASAAPAGPPTSEGAQPIPDLGRWTRLVTDLLPGPT